MRNLFGVALLLPVAQALLPSAGCMWHSRRASPARASHVVLFDSGCVTQLADLAMDAAAPSSDAAGVPDKMALARALITLAGPLLFLAYLLVLSINPVDPEEERALYREELNDELYNGEAKLQAARRKEAARPQDMAEAISRARSPAELIRESARFGVQRDFPDADDSSDDWAA